MKKKNLYRSTLSIRLLDERSTHHQTSNMQLSRICARNGGQIQRRCYSSKKDLHLSLAEKLRKATNRQSRNEEDTPKYPSTRMNKPLGSLLNKPINIESLRSASRTSEPSNGFPRSRDALYQKNQNGPRRPPFNNDGFDPRRPSFKRDNDRAPARKGSGERTSGNPFYKRGPPPPPQIEIPTWEYGTDLEKEYMNEVFKNIYDINKEGLVIFINQDGKLENGTILNYIDSVPTDSVLGVADIQEQGIEKVALVKIYERRGKLKEFSDKKADEITKQFGRTRKNKRDASLKNIKVSWEISQSDLDNQKASEILTQLKKGFKLLLVVGEKRVIGRKTFFNKLHRREEEEEQEQGQEEEEEIEDYEEEKEVFEDLNPYEELRRTKVLDQVKAMLEGNATYTIKGDIRSRVLINAEPTGKTEGAKEEVVDEKKKLKEQKKLERQMKEKLRQEKKKAKMESKKSKVSHILEAQQNDE